MNDQGSRRALFSSSNDRDPAHNFSAVRSYEKFKVLFTV